MPMRHNSQNTIPNSTMSALRRASSSWFHHECETVSLVRYPSWTASDEPSMDVATLEIFRLEWLQEKRESISDVEIKVPIRFLRCCGSFVKEFTQMGVRYRVSASSAWDDAKKDVFELKICFGQGCPVYMPRTLDQLEFEKVFSGVRQLIAARWNPPDLVKPFDEYLNRQDGSRQMCSRKRNREYCTGSGRKRSNNNPSY